MHGLKRLVQDKNAAGEHFAATAHAGRLVELDPLSEVYVSAFDPQPPCLPAIEVRQNGTRGADTAAA